MVLPGVGVLLREGSIGGRNADFTVGLGNLGPRLLAGQSGWSGRPLGPGRAVCAPAGAGRMV